MKKLCLSITFLFLFLFVTNAYAVYSVSVYGVSEEIGRVFLDWIYATWDKDNRPVVLKSPERADKIYDDMFAYKSYEADIEWEIVDGGYYRKTYHFENFQQMLGFLEIFFGEKLLRNNPKTKTTNK